VKLRRRYICLNIVLVGMLKLEYVGLFEECLLLKNVVINLCYMRFYDSMCNVVGKATAIECPIRVFDFEGHTPCG
jgi:hypothetical protein